MNVFSGSSPQEVAGLSQAVSGFKNPYAASPAISSQQRNSAEFFLRLVEFRPAWSVHCLLRFLGVTYLNENLPIPVSMGETLPVLVDGHHVISGESVMEHLAGDLGSEEKEMIDWLDEELGALIYEIKRQCGTDMSEIRKACGAHFPTAWELMIKDAAKKLWARYKREGDNRFGNKSAEEVTQHLKDSLQTVNLKLVQNGGHLLTPGRSLTTSADGGKRAPVARSSPAEAVLFGHLCEAVNANIVDLGEWEALLAFQTSVLEDYFQMSTIPPCLEAARQQNDRESFRMAMVEWRRSTDTLLLNPFVRQLPSESLTVRLLQQRTMYTTLGEQREASWRRLMATSGASSSFAGPENDDTPSEWTSHLRFSLHPLRRYLKKLESFLTRNSLPSFSSPLGEGNDEEERAALMRGDTVTIYPGGALFLTSLGACFIGYALMAAMEGRGRHR